MMDEKCPSCTVVHMRRHGYDRECLACGHKWSVTPPALELEIETTVRLEAKIDLVTYFNGLSPQAIESYKSIEFDDAEIVSLGYGEEYERPMAFLFPQDLGGGMSLTTNGPGVMRDWAEDEDIELKVRARNGSSAWGRDAEWSEEDFETLRKGVPWLDEFHATLDQPEDEEDAAALARRPGPLDDPLPLEAG